MGLESLLYISESKIAANDAERDINDLIESAQAFNSSVGITGSLLFTGTLWNVRKGWRADIR